ncbi:hypothetical protein [Microbacterium schleiferi]|uniref:hypothetical protein n=1 Tax=Microbacterium schleiferi TaxID=69362 RepID=UPI001D172142|nr:hypothetical protein [Microbacterium schleiferi]MCC4268025.1 hypothetical protein [Microbacterium schleiferi]
MGMDVNYSWYVAHIREEGSFHTASENLPVDLAEFRRELRRAMKAAGLRLQTSNQNGTFIAWDPDYVVPDEKLRAVTDAMTFDFLKLPPSCPACKGRTERRSKAWQCTKCGMTVIGKA